MSIFCLKQGPGLKALALTSTQNSLECPPSPWIAVIDKRLTLKYSYTFDQLEANSACSGRIMFGCIPHTKSGPKRRTEARGENWLADRR